MVFGNCEGSKILFFKIFWPISRNLYQNIPKFPYKALQHPMSIFWSLLTFDIIIFPDFIETYCGKNPNARFQNPDHCAQYYDCSDASFNPGLGPFLKECPFPQLFNPVNNMCADQSEVSCYERYMPLNRCKFCSSRFVYLFYTA